MPGRPVALEDLLRFQLANDAQISPDGRRVVFTVKRIDVEKNKYRSRLWMAEESGESRPFTGDGHSDSEPRWSPDGRQIAFVSDRDKPKSQIYIIGADGGEARASTNLEEGAFKGLSWSPDGSRIAFLYRETPAPWREEARKEREEKELSRPVRIHKKLFYRLDGFGYFDESYWQIYVVNVATGETKRLTDEAHYLGAPTWSPEGTTLLFNANRREDDDLHGNYEDLWTIPAGGGEIKQIQAPAGPKQNPRYSPDGRTIAFVGHTDPDDTWGGKNERILLVPAGGAPEARDLTGPSDKHVGYSTLADSHEVGGGSLVHWTPDGKSIYFPVSERGATRLYRAGVDDGRLVALTPDRHELGSFSLSADGNFIGATMGSVTDFYEGQIWRRAGDGIELQCSCAVNSEVLAEVSLQMPDTIEVPSTDGVSVQAWLIRPVSFDAGKKYPCVVYVHGGPAMQYGGQAAPIHEIQWLAANGYVVIFSNPRGSKGYGEAWCEAIKGDWGNKDWEDVQAVADYAAELPYVDRTMMAIMGGSYGGYMTAWAVGHTDRFACAIADRLVNNVHSMAGTCDFPWEHGKFYKGNAWDDPSDLWRVSPLKFAGEINTPLLLIHSDGDLRCPVSQAEELFAALRLQKKRVELVRYPPETSHGLSRNGPPDLRIDRLKRNLAWLDKHCKG